LLSLAGAMVLTRVAVVVLRPREGLIEPDPVDAMDYFSPDDIARARRYGYPQLALHTLAALAQGALLYTGIGREARAPARALPAALARGAALSLSAKLASAPLRALGRRRALRVGLDTQSWGEWAVEQVKGAALEAGFAACAAGGAVSLERHYRRAWWLIGAVASAVAGLLFTLAAPVLIDPIFNRFTALDDGPLRAEVLELARRAGVGVGEVYQVDASRRTSAANAYVTGLGATKRVVLFDTLLEGFSVKEIRLVVAHELAHVRHRDVLRGLALMALSGPSGAHAALALARRLTPPGAQPALNLSALALALEIVGVLVGVPAGALSRRVESRADAFALALTGEPGPLIAFEQRIVKQNLADPAPPRWLVALLGTHPPATERIGIALAYERSR
jgi:STE24 endopeptidase